MSVLQVWADCLLECRGASTSNFWNRLPCWRMVTWQPSWCTPSVPSFLPVWQLRDVQTCKVSTWRQCCSSTVICWSRCPHLLRSIWRTWQRKRVYICKGVSLRLECCHQEAVESALQLTGCFCWAVKPTSKVSHRLSAAAPLRNLPHLTLQSRSRGCGLYLRAPSSASNCTLAWGTAQPPAARPAPV